MCITLNRWIRKSLLLALTVLVVTPTGVCAQNWTDYNQWVPSTNFPDIGTSWTVLNDPLNSWISFPTSSVNNSWITDPGFLQSLRVEHASMLTSTMSSASGYSMTSLFSPLPSVDPMGNRSTLLESVRASSGLDYGLPPLQTGELVASAFDVMTPAGRQLTYPMFEQVAMTRVRPQLVRNQISQELNLVNQERLKVGLPRLSFEEYYGSNPVSQPVATVGSVLAGYAGFVEMASPNLDACLWMSQLAAYPEKTVVLGNLDIGLKLTKLSAAAANDINYLRSSIAHGQPADPRHMQLVQTGTRMLLNEAVPGLGELAQVRLTYSTRGWRGALTVGEVENLWYAAVKVPAFIAGTWYTGKPLAGKLAAKGVELAGKRASWTYYPLFEYAAKVRVSEPMAENELQNLTNINRVRAMNGQEPWTIEDLRAQRPDLASEKISLKHSTTETLLRGLGIRDLMTFAELGLRGIYRLFESYQMARVQPHMNYNQMRTGVNLLNQERSTLGLRRLSFAEYYGVSPNDVLGNEAPGSLGIIGGLNTLFQAGNQVMYRMLESFEMARIRPQLAEQQSWLEYNRFNQEEMLSRGFSRISYDEFLQMRTWEIKGDEWYTKGWFISDPTRGITTIRRTERFIIKISGPDYSRSGWLW